MPKKLFVPRPIRYGYRARTVNGIYGFHRLWSEYVRDQFSIRVEDQMLLYVDIPIAHVTCIIYSDKPWVIHEQRLPAYFELFRGCSKQQHREAATLMVRQYFAYEVSPTRPKHPIRLTWSHYSPEHSASASPDTSEHSATESPAMSA